MKEIEILGFAPSTYVRTARMAAVEKGVPHRLVPLDFKSAEHLAVHPFGRMPVLRHGPVVLHETLAIVAYIDRAFDGPSLQPRDALRGSEMLGLVSATIDYLYDALVRSTLGDAKPDPEATTRAFDYMEQAASTGRLAPDGKITLADLFIAPIVDFHCQGKARRSQLARRPRLSAWFDGIALRPSFQQTAPG